MADPPEAWRAVGFHVDEGNACQVGSITFNLTPGSGDWPYESRGCLSITVESDAPAAVVGSTTDICGLKWIVAPKGSAKTQVVNHPNGVIGIQKLEHNPAEAWATLVQLVHKVLPPPRQVFANKNPFGAAQHVALWKMDGQEVFEMADGMGDHGTVMQRGDPVQDEIGMLFFVCKDSEAAAATMGGHATAVGAEGRKQFGLQTLSPGFGISGEHDSGANISINVIFFMEPEEPAPKL
jgi:hypothetical protein